MALKKMRMATRATRSDRLLGMVCGRCKARLRKQPPCGPVGCQCEWEWQASYDSGKLIELRAVTKKPASALRVPPSDPKVSNSEQPVAFVVNYSSR
jgi:hypothetical protein